MTEPKTLPSLAAPLVVSFTLRFLFQTVDLVYAGLLGDSAAVAAIGLWTPFFGAFLAIWVGLSAGFTATLSTAFGRRDESRIRALKCGIRRILAVLVPFLTLVGAGISFAVPYLGYDEALTEAFWIYATTLGLGIPLASFWSIYPDSIVKAHHDTRSTMIAGFWSTGTNIVLNTVFVFVFGWGVFGLAFATVLSRFAALAYAAVRARQLEAERKAEGDWASEPTEDWPPAISAILRMSVPSGLTFGLTAAEGAFIYTLLGDETTTIAAFAVYDRMLSLAVMPTAGASVAVLPYVARNVAEKRIADVSANLRRTLLLAAAFALAFTLPAGLVFPESIGAFFLPDGAEDPAVIDRAANALALLPVAACASVPFMLLRPVFEGLHRPRIGILVSALRFVVLAFPLLAAGVATARAFEYEPLLGLVIGWIAAAALASAVTAFLCFPLRTSLSVPDEPNDERPRGAIS